MMSSYRHMNFLADEQEEDSLSDVSTDFDEYLYPTRDEEIQSSNRFSSGTYMADGPRKVSHQINDYEDSDDDLYIYEDMNQRPPKRIRSSSTVEQQPFLGSEKLFSQGSSFNVDVVENRTLKATDEKPILEALLKESQSGEAEKEATPSEGLMSVPLMKHQRIALAWMMQKEVSGWPCSGGILADDQGLGKTISTISLILTERPPVVQSSRSLGQVVIDLDDDEETDKTKTGGTVGRPSGGTLIVCPTSVLRQWDQELRSKVTSKANLSVLVYHGSNRTKHLNTLAKYDVVLTTYSIVSMEIANQETVPGKRKKRGGKSDKKRKDGPLAFVRWFRVVLDEAQCIKNYQTQVAGACCGLSAKRRWCLSGTPIQNSIDDLFSYFRFLRYDPYSIYHFFEHNIKSPILWNPTIGFQKVQALLKHIMLRRTKSTLLDGKPIINIPPKHVMMVKVEFSEKERSFYTELEAECRAKFQEYAKSGTVMYNFANLLLMLLRLRQACDHPLLLLPKGSKSDTSSVISPPIKTENLSQEPKNLSQEKQLFLLSCLGASTEIYCLCDGPPEGAVVGLCGHVYCRQCISKRLTGDGSPCPAINCRAQLNKSSVFSESSLQSCLKNDSRTSSKQNKFAESEPPLPTLQSAKIKATLKVLKALSTPKYLKSKLDSKKPLAANGNIVREKAIVFSQWTSMLDLLEPSLKESGIKYRRLDGSMSVVARDQAIRDFKTLPGVSVIIMSLKAASLGLNLVEACHVILLDPWWNPTTEDQAVDRTHRIGQTRPVTVVKLTVKDTVEDRILALQDKKRELVASAFGEDTNSLHQSRLSEADLKYLFKA